MRRARAFWLALFMTIAAVPIVTAPPASACSCVGYNFEEAVESADLIADARVRERLSPLPGEASYDVVVDRVWKGEERRQIVLRTNDQTTACGLGRLPAGYELRLWAHGEDGRYSMSWCAYPVDGDYQTEPERLTAMLGEPTDLTGEPTSLRRSWVIAGVSVPVIVLTTGLIIWLVQQRRGQRR